MLESANKKVAAGEERIKSLESSLKEAEEKNEQS